MIGSKGQGKEGGIRLRFAAGLFVAIVAGLVTCAAAAIWLIAKAHDSIALQFLGAGALVICYAAISLACVSHLWPRGFRKLAVIGLGSAGVALVAWGIGTAGWIHDPWDVMFRVAGEASAISLVSVLTGLHLALRGPTPLLRGLRWIPVISGWIFVGSLGLLMLVGSVAHLVPRNVEWLFGVTISGSVATMLLSSLFVPAMIRGAERRRRAIGESVAVATHVEMECPECCHEGVFRLGAGRCAACGFTMTIELEEPRCECGFLLYRLEGDRCPECGRAVGVVEATEATETLGASEASGFASASESTEITESSGAPAAPAARDAPVAPEPPKPSELLE